MLIHHGFHTKIHGNDITVKHTDEDPIYFDHCDSEALHEILDTQHKNTQLNTPRRKTLRYYFRY